MLDVPDHAGGQLLRTARVADGALLEVPLRLVPDPFWYDEPS